MLVDAFTVLSLTGKGLHGVAERSRRLPSLRISPVIIYLAPLLNLETPTPPALLRGLSGQRRQRAGQGPPTLVKMTDQDNENEATPEAGEAAPAQPTPPRRSPGHRGQDVRDTVAELAARAHEISLEAGSKMSGALRDVIGAAAGITAFAIESARDLVQYMVRRGQMTQEEADKLIREAEEADAKRPKSPARSDGVKKEKAASKATSRAKAPAKTKAAPAKKPPARKAPAKKAAPKK